MDRAPQGSGEDTRNRDRVAAAVLALFGLFWVIAAARQQYFVDTPYVSLSFLPMAAGASLALIAGYLVIRAPAAPVSAMDEPSEPLTRTGLVKTGLALLALLVYAILLPRVHSLATTFGLMVVGLLLADEPLRPRLFIIAAVVALLLFGIFVMWLGVPLPGGRFS